MIVSNNKGFTLIELMIVIAIIAIIAAVAMPAYSDYITKAKRTEAKAELLIIQLAQERWRANNSSYGALTDLGYSNPHLIDNYSITVSGAAASSYQIIASPTGQQLAADTFCGAISIDQSSTTTESGTASSANDCWKR